MVCSDGLYNEGTPLTSTKSSGVISPVVAKLGALAPCVLPETSLEEDRAITRGLMILSEKSFARILENEPDIYTVEDLKIRFR